MEYMSGLVIILSVVALFAYANRKPKIGSRWVYPERKDPFKPVQQYDVFEIVDIKDGWVKFEYINDRKRQGTMSFSTLNLGFKRIKK